MKISEYKALTNIESRLEGYLDSACITKESSEAEDRARLYLSVTEGLNSALVQKFVSAGGYIDIIITNISLPFKEKVQTHALWGDNYYTVYYGMEPMTIGLSGVMYNAANHDWWNQFIKIYLDALRGSRLSLTEQTVCLNYYETNYIFFSIVSFDSGVDAGMQTRIPFTMGGIVHKIHIAEISEKEKSNKVLRNLAIQLSPQPPASRKEPGSILILDQFYEPEIIDESKNETNNTNFKIEIKRH